MVKKPLQYLLSFSLLAAPLTSFAIDLKGVYQLALENEHQLKADEAAYRAGIQAKIINRTGIVPNIGASAEYSDINIETGFSNFNTASRSVNYSISLTQALFDLNAWYTYKQGLRLTDQAEAQFAADEQAFILRVANAYFDVLRAADVLENSIALEKALKSQLEQTQQRFEVGLTAITDVHNAQADYDSARAQTLGNRNTLGSAYDTLEVITGALQNSVSSLSDNFPVTEPVPNTRQEWVDFALQNNNSLKAAKLAAEAARQSSKAAASAILPTVDATLLASQDHNFDGDPDIDRDGFTVSVTLPITNGGGLNAQKRQAHAQYTQTQESYLQTKREVIQSARSQHLGVLTDVATVSARKQAIISSESSLEATQAGYEVGTRDFVDVLNAQQGVFEAKSNYYNALYDYIIDTLSLKQTAGTLTPGDILELNNWLDSADEKTRANYGVD
ncbi:TolC family outer membrane protein [Sessilibacter sp. MAH2]